MCMYTYFIGYHRTGNFCGRDIFALVNILYTIFLTATAHWSTVYLIHEPCLQYNKNFHRTITSSVVFVCSCQVEFLSSDWHVQVQLKSSLQELFSERRQLQQDSENTKSKCARFESIARRMKEQNEVLCERVREKQAFQLLRGREGGREKAWVEWLVDEELCQCVYTSPST